MWEKTETVAQRPGDKRRRIILAIMLVAVLAVGLIPRLQGLVQSEPFADRVAAIAAETFSTIAPIDRLAGYAVADVCFIPAGADPQAIATAGGIPASELINVVVANGEVGVLMHGEGQTTFGALPISAWADTASLSLCFSGGGLALAFDTVDPLRGGRLVIPVGGTTNGVEAQPLPPVPR